MEGPEIERADQNRPVNERVVPTVGRIVHFTDPTAGWNLCRAAIIVHTFEPGRQNGAVNLTVLPDWGNDRNQRYAVDGGMFWATSVQNEEVPGFGPRWHWPERV